MEDIHPLGNHPRFLKEWVNDVAAAAADTLDDTGGVDMILDFRKAIHACGGGGCEELGESDDSWKWLISAHQVEQRTEEWYAETKNILTASEVSAIFKGGGTRAALIMKKVGEPRIVGKPLSVKREDTSAMDWGVRYEPVVKAHLEKSLACKIAELGRIRHRTDARIAASPDGLIVEAAEAQLVGRLVEIKCPYTRVINEKISFDYWCQMQLQMEVCDRPVCEFVEVKIRENGENPGGWITLQTHSDTYENRYVYHDTAEPAAEEEGWVSVETYSWEIATFKRVSVLRDKSWYQQSQEAFDKFWVDVEGARAGTWTPPPRREKKVVEAKCEIVDDVLPETEAEPEPLRILIETPNELSQGC